MKTILPKRLLLCATALWAGSFAMSPAHAIGGAEPLTEILTAPGSAGLGIVSRIATSPYRGGGTRFDLLPLYLYEGERLFFACQSAGCEAAGQG